MVPAVGDEDGLERALDGLVAVFGEDATATPGSGTMFNHVNIDEVKTVADTLTITATITVG